MDIVTSIPVPVKPLESESIDFGQLRERIGRRAYENFVRRGSVDGHDLEDWLKAENELLMRLRAEVFSTPEDIVVDVELPHSHLDNLTIYLAPTLLVIASDVDEEGRQVLETIALPLEICVDGVDAERTDSTLRITTAIAERYQTQRASA